MGRLGPRSVAWLGWERPRLAGASRVDFGQVLVDEVERSRDEVVELCPDLLARQVEQRVSRAAAFGGVSSMRETTAPARSSLSGAT